MPFLRQHIILEELGLTPLWLSRQGVAADDVLPIKQQVFACEGATKTAILLWQATGDAAQDQTAAALMADIAAACRRIFAQKIVLLTLSQTPPVLDDWQAQDLPAAPILAFGSAANWANVYDLAAAATVAPAQACLDGQLKAQIWADCQRFFAAS